MMGIPLKTLATLLLCACFAGHLQCQTPRATSSSALLLQHVTIIDSTGSPPRNDVSIQIINGRIESISSTVESGRSVNLPKNVRVINASGKFLIAGLWDMHVHALSKNQPDHFFPLFVANGVTGIRDMGGDIPLPQIAQLKQEIAVGIRLGPEVYAAGPILEGPKPFWPFSIAVRDSSDARQSVSTLAKQEADFLKVYNTLQRDSYMAIASQAKETGIPFVGHIPDDVTPEEASNLGQKSIEHLWGIPSFLTSDTAQLRKMQTDANDSEDPALARDLFYKINQTVLATYDTDKASRLFKEFVRNQTWQTPTLVVLRSYTRIHDPKLREDPRIAYITDDLLNFWNSMGGPPDPRNDEIQMRLFNHNLEIVRAMQTAGVPLLAGTDTPNPYTYPGFSLHDELELLVSAGLSPAEALQTATLRPAQFLGVEHDFGSVQEGKVANLVLLDANPLEDIRNIRKIRAVILRRTYLDRKRLDQLLEHEKKRSSPR